MKLISLPSLFKSRLGLAGLSLAILFLLVACHKEGERSGTVYRIGYMNCNTEPETIARFGPLTAYLSEKTGLKFEMVTVNTEDFEERFNQGEFAFTHTNSLLYVILKERSGLKLLASEKRGQFGARSAGTIIARKDSGITTLADLKGKRLVFGPFMAPTGFVAQYDLLLRAGIDPEKDLAYYAVPPGSYKHEKVLYGLLYGQYDAAAAPALDLEVMTREGKITADDFIVLAQSVIIPYCTFGVGQAVDAKVAEKVRKALAELTPESTAEFDGERVKVLKAAWVDGFEELLDSDFDPLREMAKRAKMPPYEEF
ncbi:MAG: phosphate/phosphite/phosphonate ABC transporter substrate-binding protein [Desulfuromonadales bacterium]|nr:phosphate/phosphite/phosphonate ABC transporter substrate-binding protein [Desulfuromonadales bacterium]